MVTCPVSPVVLCRSQALGVWSYRFSSMYRCSGFPRCASNIHVYNCKALTERTALFDIPESVRPDPLFILFRRRPMSPSVTGCGPNTSGRGPSTRMQMSTSLKGHLGGPCTSTLKRFQSRRTRQQIHMFTLPKEAGSIATAGEWLTNVFHWLVGIHLLENISRCRLCFTKTMFEESRDSCSTLD